MANLPETPQFDEGIYQIETVDPVVGGPNGISNESARGLANRTRYLKNQVDALQSQKAPLHSPNFTGAPTVPTPGISDSSAQIATTGWVAQRVTNLAAPAAHVGAGGNAHPAATTSTAGFMSASDKQKLDGIAAGAQANAVTSVAGKTGAVTLAVSDVPGAAPLTAPRFTGHVVIDGGASRVSLENGAHLQVISDSGGIHVRNTDIMGRTAADLIRGSTTVHRVPNMQWISQNVVNSINGKRGDISKLAVADVDGAAPLASPRFTGSTYFSTGGNKSAFTTDGYFNHNHKYMGTLANVDDSYVPNIYALKRLFAALDGPVFTGSTRFMGPVDFSHGVAVTANTVANDNNSFHVATTGWVRNAMANIASTQGFAKSGNWTSGFFKLPSWLGSLIIQWVHVNSASTGHNTVRWPISWPNECLAAIISPRDGSSWTMGVTPAIATFSWECPTARNGNNAAGTVFGIGW